MLSPSIALLISIAGILVLLRLKLHPGLAIFAGSLIVSLLVLPLNGIPAHMLTTLIDLPTLRLMIIVASAMTISSLMEEKGLLLRLAAAMESIGSRLAIRVVPAVIGLVPMPGGALVSATASRGLAERLKLSPERATFINYWFRHIWEFSVPIYPAIILASVVLSLPIITVVKTLAPMTVLIVVLGSIVSYRMLRNTPETKGRLSKGIALDFFKAAWPILLLITLTLAGIEAMIVFPATLFLLVLVLLAGQPMLRWPSLKKALKYGLNPAVLFLLYAIMLYKATIESSGAAGMLITDMQAIGLPAPVVLVALPLLMGLATGYSPAFAGVALPLLVPYIASGAEINGYALLLAYVSGMMGVLLSPLHLCLILSAEYFKASLSIVFRYLLPLAMLIEAIVIGAYYLMSF